MLKSDKLQMAIQNRRGASAVIVAICLVMLIGFAALAIDVGYLYSTRNELQNIADAGALAGAGYLGSVYETLTYSQQQVYEFARQDIVDAVNQVSQKNKAAGVSISINDGDIIIGRLNWGYDPPRVDPTTPIIGPDAVQVTARRDNIANNPVATFFARVFGQVLIPVSTDAIAALTGSLEVGKGELKTPFGLSQCIFPQSCTDLISFSPTTDSCAGWHNFFDHADSHRMEEKMLGLIKGDGNGEDWDGDGNVDNPCFKVPCGQDWLNGNFDLQKEPVAETTPEAQSGDEVNFQGGDIGSLFLGGVLDTDYDGVVGTVIGDEKHPAPFPALFDYFRYRDDDGDDTVWTATVPVYADDVCCTNPNTALEIVFFAKIVIRMPNPPPDKTVTVTLDCNNSFTAGRGGGGKGNLKGTIPNIVK